MKILTVLPDNKYFLWQMLVQMNNLKKMGLDKDTIYVIGKRDIQPSNILMKIIKKTNFKGTFYILNDEREHPKYSSSLRPHLLAKLFKNHNELQNETFFYLDPDVIFTKKINFGEFLKDDVWYLSDTRSYINSKYIKGKDDKLFIEMCKIVGINPQTVENNDENAGGAQYLMKNINAEYWKKVEDDSEKLFQYMIKTSHIYCPQHPIQAWTADMWAVLWNAWYFGNNTKISKKLNFSWATEPIKNWTKNGLYHNAGAVIDDGTFFVKTAYQISPFNKEIKCNEDNCSFNYLKEIKDTENNFKEILF
jgi:hypothetical protein